MLYTKMSAERWESNPVTQSSLQSAALLDEAMQICSAGSLIVTLLGALAVSEPLTLGKIPDFRCPGSLGRVEPVRCGVQRGACSAGSRRQQRQDGCHDCTRLLSKRKSYLHSLNTQGLGFPLGKCCCLPEGCFSLNSGKVHPQLFPETSRPPMPTTMPSAGGGSCPAWTRRVSLLTEEGQPSDGGGPWDLASGRPDLHPLSVFVDSGARVPAGLVKPGVYWSS